MKKTIFRSPLTCILLLGFLLGIYNGQIGVWKDQDPEPMRTIPCPVWVLSQTQRQMLQNGIPLNSMQDLEKLLTEFFP